MAERVSRKSLRLRADAATIASAYTYRASGLNLLVAAIILWNTRYLEMALADIGTADEIARHIAPLGWEHISLTGDYSWNVEDQPDPDALRPLRAVNSLLAA